MLEIIATKLATSEESTDHYIKNTLLYHTIDHDELTSMVKETVEELETSELITKGSDTEYSATLLGQAIVASSLTPEDGLFVHRELRKALQAFVMDGEMHVLYLFTPVQAAQTNINWQIFSNVSLEVWKVHVPCSLSSRPPESVPQIGPSICN